MPLHRKRTHRSKVLAAAVGVGLTVSGVAYAAQAGRESVSSASDPVDASSAPPSPTTSTSSSDLPQRDVHPSRSITTRAALRDKPDRRADKKRPKPSPAKASTSRTAMSTTPPSTTPAPDRTTVSARSRTPTPTTRTQAPETTSKAPSSGSRILGGTNAARSKDGLPPLSTSSCLATLAQRHAERLADARTLYHQDLGNVMSTCGMSTAGENVAMNYSQPSDMVTQWLNSPGHRANMLSRRFSLIGIGVAQASDGAWYGVQVFGDR